MVYYQKSQKMPVLPNRILLLELLWTRYPALKHPDSG